MQTTFPDTHSLVHKIYNWPLSSNIDNVYCISTGPITRNPCWQWWRMDKHDEVWQPDASHELFPSTCDKKVENLEWSPAAFSTFSLCSAFFPKWRDHIFKKVDDIRVQIFFLQFWAAHRRSFCITAYCTPCSSKIFPRLTSSKKDNLFHYLWCFGKVLTLSFGSSTGTFQNCHELPWTLPTEKVLAL